MARWNDAAASASSSAMTWSVMSVTAPPTRAILPPSRTASPRVCTHRCTPSIGRGDAKAHRDGRAVVQAAGHRGVDGRPVIRVDVQDGPAVVPVEGGAVDAPEPEQPIGPGEAPVGGVQLPKARPADHLSLLAVAPLRHQVELEHLALGDVVDLHDDLLRAAVDAADGPGRLHAQTRPRTAVGKRRSAVRGSRSPVTKAAISAWSAARSSGCTNSVNGCPIRAPAG